MFRGYRDVLYVVFLKVALKKVTEILENFSSKSCWPQTQEIDCLFIETVMDCQKLKS